MTFRTEGPLTQENSVLRWGGLAGILGGLVFILVPVVLFGFVPAAPAGSFVTEGGGSADPTALVMMFPQSRAPIALGNFLNSISAMMSLALILAVYRSLRETGLAPALFGSVMYVLGLGVLFTETVTQVAFDPISNIYHAPGATAAEQATSVLLWQATQGLLYELDAAASLLISAGMIILGLGMLRSKVFGRVYGGLTLVLGTASLITISAFGITSFLAAFLLIPIFVVIPIVLGWKVYRLSRTSGV